jgi:hypothetical protein
VSEEEQDLVMREPALHIDIVGVWPLGEVTAEQLEALATSAGRKEVGCA